MIGLGSKNDCIYIPLYWLQVQCHGRTIKVHNDWRKRLMNSRLCDIMNRFAKSHFPLTYIYYVWTFHNTNLTWISGFKYDVIVKGKFVSTHVKGFYSHVMGTTDSRFIKLLLLLQRISGYQGLGGQRCHQAKMTLFFTRPWKSSRIKWQA